MKARRHATQNGVAAPITCAVRYGSYMQQVLNVRGSEALWCAIRLCWASQWNDHVQPYLADVLGTTLPAMAGARIVLAEHADGERRGPSERCRWDVSSGTFRSAQALGDRRRRAPRCRWEQKIHARPSSSNSRSSQRLRAYCSRSTHRRATTSCSPSRPCGDWARVL